LKLDLPTLLLTFSPWLIQGDWRSSWTGTGLFKKCLWHCTQGWCRWSTNWVWSHRKPLLGIWDTGCYCWYCYHGEGIYQNLIFLLISSWNLCT
jgi:hypothetical protein